jgi:hypothetical protein
VKATFHERQYELAANLELIGGGGSFFAPLQLIEESVGYDIALVPGDLAVWAQLGEATTPVGVETPIAYDTKAEPTSGGQVFTASLFVQYKRPERMKRRSAAETRRRQSQGGGIPFFRVHLDRDQHEVLAELENRVGADAVVRYAAPIFHRIEDLWVRQATRAVVAASTFIPPSTAGNPPSCWTYDDSGSPIFCSEPRRGQSEGRDEVLRALVRTARDRAGRREHLRALASEIESIDLTPRRRRRLDESDQRRVGERGYEAEWVRPPLDRWEWSERLRSAAPERLEGEIASAVDAAVIAHAVSSIGLTWFIGEIRHTQSPAPAQ